ncbi:MAG: TrkH family potassium uptake protein [Candidatus Kuenenia sp.]|nr:TrkH family potassium uptake protein [Candidatus Kuenenia hertensis]
MLALLTLAPIGVSLVFAEYPLTLRYVLIELFLLSYGLTLLRLPAPTHIQANETFAIIGLTFIFFPFLMSFPMMRDGLSFLDALFEAISGITTTGLSTLTCLEDKTRTFLFTRAWMQWYGGLGFVILSVALLMRHNIAAKRLIEPEPTTENLVVTTQTYAHRILCVYLLLTLIGIFCVWLLIGDCFAAITHILSAVSTGGFSMYNNNVSHIASPIGQYGIMFFCLLGAISLPLYYRIFHNSWKKTIFDIELRTLLVSGFAVSGILIFFAVNSGTMPWKEALIYLPFLGFSAQTTTGFSNLELFSVDPASKLILIISMISGGSIGSTAGGIKILRLLILFRIIQFAIKRTAVPHHAVIFPSLTGKRLESEDIIRTLLVIMLFIILILASWLPFILYGYSPLDALFEVVSATGTVGLSTGITRNDLEPVLKGILCFDMLAGRLEILALLVVLYPGTWFGKRGESL